METIDDPWPMLGPPAPHRIRTFDEVLSDIGSGAMLPMTAPVDANGRAGHRYDSLAFAPTVKPVLLDARDMTPDLLKVIDFFSDGSAHRMARDETLSIYYLADARVTSSVHRLTAYDRDDGPETLLDLTTQATVSGYLIIRSDESVAEVTMKIGLDGDEDATKNVVLAEQASRLYSACSFPTRCRIFNRFLRDRAFESPDMWTFTTSASPMVDEWGTWQRLRKRRTQQGTMQHADRHASIAASTTRLRASRAAARSPRIKSVCSMR